MVDRVYAIGDIHGDFDKLRDVLSWIDADLLRERPLSHHIVLVGDLVDRRHQSKDVIEYLIRVTGSGAPMTALRGNHDRMFSMFLDNPNNPDPILRPDLTWLHPRLGGDTTLASYGVENANARPLEDVHREAVSKVPEAHRAFLAALPVTYETEQAFFTHAGIKPNVPLANQVEDDLIWIRGPFHDHTAPHPKLIVHGHTPVDQVTHYGNRINIDTGCAYGGPLSAIVLEGVACWQITAEGRVPLPAP